MKPQTALQINQPQLGQVEIMRPTLRQSVILKKYYHGVELKGAFTGMPMDAYLAAPGHSSSSLKELLKSPLQYRRKRNGLIGRESSEAMEMGTVLHSAILEGRLDYHIQPATYGDGKKWSNNANECKAWNATHSDKPVLTESEAAFVAESFSYVRSHPKCAQLLQGGYAEVSMFAEIGGELFKSRCDYYKPGFITDLKSVTDASSREFGKAVSKYGWHIQAALYVRIAAELGDTNPRFTWLALQKGEMPLLNVLRASQAWLNIGDDALAEALTLHQTCTLNKFWPEWPDYDGTNTVQDLPVPAWMLGGEEIEVSIGGQSINL